MCCQCDEAQKKLKKQRQHQIIKLLKNLVMRTQTTTLFTNLSKETVKNLVTEVKETLAYGICGTYSASAG